MYQIRKVFKFEAAHALSSSYSKECQKIHGHSYVVEVFIKSERLNTDGMVVDFKMLKEKIGNLFDNWDHSLVVHEKDKREEYKRAANLISLENPTAENMAKLFYEEIKHVYLAVSKVRVHETDTGWAEYSEER